MRFRYRLQIDVTAEEQYITITLIDAAQCFFGCDLKEYVQSTSKKVNHILHKRTTSIKNFTLCLVDIYTNIYWFCDFTKRRIWLLLQDGIE